MPDASNVRVAVSGAVMKGALNATAPTGTASAPTGFTDLGFISEDGVEIELPDAGDAEPIKAWQNGTVVRTIRTPSEDNPSWVFTLLETSIAAIETYFGVEVTSTANEGSFEFKNTLREHNAYIIDAIDGADLQRDYLPKGIVASVGSHTLSGTDATAYEVTLEAEFDSDKDFNFKRWSTALRTIV
jgi:hypothetical protein